MLKQVAEKVSQYLDGRLSRDDLEDWLWTRIDQIDRSGDEWARKLHFDVTSGFVFVDEEVMTLEELHQELRGTLRQLAPVTG